LSFVFRVVEDEGETGRLAGLSGSHSGYRKGVRGEGCRREGGVGGSLVGRRFES